MPTESKPQKRKQQKQICVDDLRHAEYYGMQKVFDGLYQQSVHNEVFTNLTDTIFSRDNILLAYRNIKTNSGSKTPGTDKTTIQDIGKLSPEEVVKKVQFIAMGSKHGYRPKPVRRKEIPKPNGATRPLGIPCMWDRLVQQCIKQVLEPICEAKFSRNSYGFRPERSAENALAAAYKYLQNSHLYYVCEFDIQGFFDNVNHAKLIRQIWALGIHDKHLIYILRQILTAPIRLEDGTIQIPKKGTPQGGILSPLLANIVLNELDHWIESQWEENPHVYEHRKLCVRKDGTKNKGSGYEWMRTATNMKEMYIVRYADDFRIFCRTKETAEKTLVAVIQWIKERLKLDVSPEKTRVVDAKRHYTEFLGFKLRMRKKGQKLVVESHICDKAKQRIIDALSNQAKAIARPNPERNERGEILRYNSMVMGIQNYYAIATDISLDMQDIHHKIDNILTNRLSTQTGKRLRKSGRPLTEVEQKRYGGSKQLRYVAGTEEPIYPIGYIRCRNPMFPKKTINRYTPEGRLGLHEELKQINKSILGELMRQSNPEWSIQYADNRLSLFCAQMGTCAIKGTVFKSLDEIHCHHITPKAQGGTDEYNNLVLVDSLVHRLIHATAENTVRYYLEILNLNKNQIRKLNEFRILAGNAAIEN